MNLLIDGLIVFAFFALYRGYEWVEERQWAKEDKESAERFRQLWEES
jgi:hypothetical protein